ncbi:hypothetical protein WKH33_17625 [Priestia sp. WB3]
MFKPKWGSSNPNTDFQKIYSKIDPAILERVEQNIKKEISMTSLVPHWIKEVTRLNE